jgi:septal ring factor EnvC (AmiA/AmiB activator)
MTNCPGNTIEQRKKLAKKLTDLRATQRATAKVLGVAHSTISDDLGRNRPPLPPSITQSGNEAAISAQKAAKKAAAAEETKAKRETSRSAPAFPGGPELRIGDAREVLSDIANDSVHLILTDPPYGESAIHRYAFSSIELVKCGVKFGA